MLQRLGLDRPELRAWALYDWANSAYITTIVTAVFPVYYRNVAATGLETATATARYAGATTAALLTVAVMAPFLGAVADAFPLKKRLLAGFMGGGAASAAGMGLVGPGDWALALGLFMAGNVGVFGSFIFYDSLLPHVARREEVDRVSAAGYALGYLGGGLLLAVNLAWLTHPEWFGLADAGAAARLSFVSVALWWVVFSLPLLRRVPEPPAVPGSGRPPALRPGAVLGQLRGTLRELLRFREAALFLGAFLIYNDGIGTIIRMAALYGAELGLGSGTLVGAVLMVQFAGIPFAFLFGALAGRIGAKRAVLLALGVYVAITVMAWRVDSAADFFVLAFLVATVQGGCQALSRSLFASMIPPGRSAEFFAFFSVCEKASAVLGPATFALAVTWTGSSRTAILVVAVFFLAGGALLTRVDVARGRARAAEAQAAP